MNNLVLRKNGTFAKRNNQNLNPFEWSSWIDNFINSEFTGVETRDFNTGISSPKVNIAENKDAFTLEMAIPGFEKKDFVIDVENEELSISVEKESVKDESKTEFSRREFGYASFKRTFVLPETVDQNKIEASYNNGILDVTIPKREEAKPKPAQHIKVS